MHRLGSPFLLVGTTSAMFSAFENLPCSTQQLNKSLMYGKRIKVLYLRNLMLLLFSLTDLFDFTEQITVVTSSGVIDMKKGIFNCYLAAISQLIS